MPLILSFKKPNFVLTSESEGLIESTELFRYSGRDFDLNLKEGFFLALALTQPYHQAAEAQYG